MKKYYLACTLAFVFCNYLFSQPGQWRFLGPNRHYFGGTSAYMFDITFADSLVGYATNLVDPEILKTVDGGVTWQLKQASINAHQAQFVNAQIGWLNNGFIIAKTTNGGDSWVNQLDTNSSGLPNTYFWDISFTNPLTAFVSGINYIGKTLDGGNTWTNITPFALDSSWRKTHFLNADTGWAFSTDSVVARTYDGGQSWTQQIIHGLLSYDDVTGVRFFNSSQGIVITRYGQVFKTYDAGNTWVQGVTSSANFDQAKFGANGFVYGLSGTSIFLSVDTGNTWVTKTISENSYAIYFQNPSTGFAGFQHIYKTMDGGTTWQTDEQPYPTSNYPIVDIGWTSSTNVIAPSVYGVLESYDNTSSWVNNTNSDVYTIQNVSPTCYFERTGNSGVVRVESGTPTLTLTNDYTFLYAKSRDSFIISHRPWGAELNILRTINGGNTYDTIFHTIDTGGIYYGEWGDAGMMWSNYSTTFARFMDWNTGIVAYQNIAGVSKEFVTLDGGAYWKSYPPDTSRILATKISPKGGLFCLRMANSYRLTFSKLDSNMQWQFVNYIDWNVIPFSSYAVPDFDWSADSLLWTTSDNPAAAGNCVYSTDEGNSWRSFPKSTMGFTMLKRLPNGKFIGGTAWGELLEYDGSQHNCRIKGNVFLISIAMELKMLTT